MLTNKDRTELENPTDPICGDSKSKFKECETLFHKNVYWYKADKVEETLEKIEFSLSDQIIRIHEVKQALEITEIERDELKSKVKWFNQILSGNSKRLEEKLQALEKIARRILELWCSSSIEEKYLKEIDELMEK